MIKKHGRFFWLDIYVGGKRVRRSLTGNKFEALDRYKEVKDKLLAQQRGGKENKAPGAAVAARLARLRGRADITDAGIEPHDERRRKAGIILINKVGERT